MRMTSTTVMVIFFQSGILKVTWSQLRRHTDNSIWRDTLQLYILRTWISMRTKSFTKTSVNVTEMNIWTKIETTFHLFYALLFLWNLVFKFNLVLIGNFFYNFHHNLFTLFCLFFLIWYIADLKVYPKPLGFFIRTSKILMRLGVLLLKVFSFKMFLLCSFFMKNAYLITAKITLDVNNCL